MFLVGAWTGLRFSDYSKLTTKNIKGDFLHVTQQKTGGRVTIPLHPTVRAIFERNGGRPPKGISPQTLNKYLKEIAKAAGFMGYVEKVSTKGGKRVTERFEKWERVTSHTARRSFATNLYKADFPAESIMQITGHKTQKAFLTYLKLDAMEHAKKLQLHWQKRSVTPLFPRKDETG